MNHGQEVICEEQQGCPEDKHPTPHQAPDGGWGYAVVAGAFLAFAIMGGVMSTFTLVYAQFCDRFGRNSAETAWANAIYGALGFLASKISKYATGLKLS